MFQPDPSKYPVDPAKFEAEVAFQLRHGGYVTPPGPLPCAEAAARALLTVEARPDLVLWTEDDDIPWDGDGEPPTYNLCLAIIRVDEDRALRLDGRPAGDWLASLGIGVDSLSDPYLRTVFADLALEVLADETREQERIDAYNAAEMASRATFAGPTEETL